MDDIREELVLLKASLVEGELEWVDEDVQAEWEVSAPWQRFV